MKKLALAIAVAAISGQALAAEIYKTDDASLDLYGEIRTRLKKADSDSFRFDGDNTRIGMKGKYNISEDFYALGEFRVSANINNTDQGDGDFSDSDDDLTFNRGYVGFGSNTYGEVRVGRMPSVHDELFGYDITWVFGGSAKNAADLFGTDVAESAFQYEWTNDNFRVIGQVQGRSGGQTWAENAMDSDGKYIVTKVDNKDSTKQLFKNAKVRNGYALGGSWNSNFGLGLSTVYTTVEIETDSEIAGANEADVDSFGFEATYQINQLSLAASAFKFEQQADDKKQLDRDQDAFGASAYYAFSNGIGLYGVYDYIETTDNHALIAKNDKKLEKESTTYTVGVDYWPHEQVLTFIEFAQNKTDDNKAGTKSDTQGLYSVGARFYF